MLRVRAKCPSYALVNLDGAMQRPTGKDSAVRPRRWRTIVASLFVGAILPSSTRAIEPTAVLHSQPTSVAKTSQLVRTVPATGYNGIWYQVGKTDDEYRYKYSGGMATYCAKHSPFAVYCAQVDKTFFCYGGTTPDRFTSLVHMVSFYDHRTHMVARPRMLLDKQTSDAHDNPVISVDSQGHIWLFSTSHGTGRPSYIHKSVKPYSIDAFQPIAATHGSEADQAPLDNFSYFQAWHTPSIGFAAFFTHYNDPVARTSMFMTSADGRRWSQWKRLAAFGQGHYQISAVRGQVAAATFNYHPQDKGLDWRTNLYYITTPNAGRTWTNVSETEVNVPLTSAQNACLVHDFQSEARNVYVKDLQFDRRGQPVILVVTSGGHKSGPQNDPRLWELFHYSCGNWNRSILTDSDSNYDMGSLYIEGGTWRVIAPTSRGPQAYNPGGEMVAWTSSDQGQTWQPRKLLTSQSELNHSYARRPVNAHPGFYCLWSDGHGRQPSESRLYFSTRRGQVYRLPTTMNASMQRPEPVGSPSEPLAGQK